MTKSFEQNFSFQIYIWFRSFSCHFHEIQKYDEFIIAASSHKEGNERLKAAGAHCICAKSQFSHINEIINYVASNQRQLIQDFPTDFSVGEKRTAKNSSPKTEEFLEDLGIDF